MENLIQIRVPMKSLLSERMVLLGLIKENLQTALIFATSLQTRSKCSSIMGQNDIHKYANIQKNQRLQDRFLINK